MKKNIADCLKKDCVAPARQGGTLRTFARHLVRKTGSLGGRWGFVIDPERTGRAKLPSRFNRSVYVPSVWESIPGLENYRGKAWFKTDIPVRKGLTARLVFGGVSHRAKVYVDGRECGSHEDAYTPWDVIAGCRGKKGVSEVVVEVDNSFGEHSALHIPNDYYTYGGITRPVEVQYVPDVFIDNLAATPVRTKTGWSLHITVRLRNISKTRLSRRVSVECHGHEWDFGRVSVRPEGYAKIKRVFQCCGVQPWSPGTPKLYGITAKLWDGPELVDDLMDRVGFRVIEVKGTKLLLNGKELRLRGYNRHEDHSRFGCAVPIEAMAQDLDIMRDLNCNFVRTSHYPNDMRFLDMCDELGICVWEESHARTVDLQHPLFRAQIENSTREMMAWHHNHPSIIIWGCLNECVSSTPAGRREHRFVIKLIRSLDSSRPVTFADNHGTKDICLDLVDIVSWNRYYGWYRDKPEETADKIAAEIRWLDSAKSRGGKGKPLIMSEFGAGAIPGCRDVRAVHWSEEYQARVLDCNLKAYLDNPRICGVAIWQFCDVRVTPEGDARRRQAGWWAGRPRTMNNKGTVDEFRRPKLSYEVVKKHFIPQP